tara:strand:- start:64 stop:402 length:339 start_codon:yes stop_codon:yes gene_type:complete
MGFVVGSSGQLTNKRNHQCNKYVHPDICTWYPKMWQCAIDGFVDPFAEFGDAYYKMNNIQRITIDPSEIKDCEEYLNKTYKSTTNKSGIRHWCDAMAKAKDAPSWCNRSDLP